MFTPYKGQSNPSRVRQRRRETNEAFRARRSRLWGDFRDAKVFADCRKHRKHFMWAFYGVEMKYILKEHFSDGRADTPGTLEFRVMSPHAMALS